MSSEAPLVPKRFRTGAKDKKFFDSIDWAMGQYSASDVSSDSQEINSITKLKEMLENSEGSDFESSSLAPM